MWKVTHAKTILQDPFQISSIQASTKVKLKDCYENGNLSGCSFKCLCMLRKRIIIFIYTTSMVCVVETMTTTQHTQIPIFCYSTYSCNNLDDNHNTLLARILVLATQRKWHTRVTCSQTCQRYQYQFHPLSASPIQSLQPAEDKHH